VYRAVIGMEPYRRVSRLKMQPQRFDGLHGAVSRDRGASPTLRRVIEQGHADFDEIAA
jgi:hypothetical protein